MPNAPEKPIFELNLPTNHLLLYFCFQFLKGNLENNFLLLIVKNLRKVLQGLLKILKESVKKIEDDKNIYIYINYMNLKYLLYRFQL